MKNVTSQEFLSQLLNMPKPCGRVLQFLQSHRDATGRASTMSVLAKARGRGFGHRLFEHAMLHARNRGVRTLVIYALSENTTMLRIARKAGAEIEREGAESQAQLTLPENGSRARTIATSRTLVIGINIDIFSSARFSSIAATARRRHCYCPAP